MELAPSTEPNCSKKRSRADSRYIWDDLAKKTVTVEPFEECENHLRGANAEV
jgi:hypothetical protein